MHKHFESVLQAEQGVDDARSVVITEYRAAHANLRRRARSPVVLGGLLLGGIAAGYFLLGRGRSNQQHVYRAGTDTLSRVVETTRLLLPLLVAIIAATRSVRASDSHLMRTEN